MNFDRSGYIHGIFFCLLIGCPGLGAAQGFLMPKVGWITTLKPPTVDTFVVDSRQGVMYGMELRSGQKSIYFNPGLFAEYNNIDVYYKGGPSSSEGGEVLLKTRSLWLKLKVGVGANIYNKDDYFKVHLRGALSPALLIVRPYFKGIEPITTNYRKIFIENHFGFGIDLGKFALDFDYHIMLVRKIHKSDIVENTFMISFGYALR